MARDDDARQVVRGSEAVQAAARRILAGDESIRAANVLESAILADLPDDDDVDELVYVLGMYRPGGGREYSGVDELRVAILDALGATGRP
jgi:hypothetical protein